TRIDDAIYFWIADSHRVTAKRWCRWLHRLVRRVAWQKKSDIPHDFNPSRARCAHEPCLDAFVSMLLLRRRAACTLPSGARRESRQDLEHRGGLCAIQQVNPSSAVFP